MAKNNVDQYLRSITDGRYDVKDGQIPMDELASGLRAVLSNKMRAATDNVVTEAAMKENLWVTEFTNGKPGELKKVELAEGESMYQHIAKGIAEGKVFTLPTKWTATTEGMVNDNQLGFEEGMARFDMIAIGGGMYKDKFYMQVQTQDEHAQAEKIENPITEPGFWDKFVDFFKSLFNSRDEVCATWDAYYSEPNALGNVKDRGSDVMLRQSSWSPYTEANWSTDPNRLRGQLDEAMTKDDEFMHFDTPADVRHFCRNAIQQRLAMKLFDYRQVQYNYVNEHSKEIVQMMKDVKAFVVNNISDEEINSMVGERFNKNPAAQKFADECLERYSNHVMGRISGDISNEGNVLYSNDPAAIKQTMDQTKAPPVPELKLNEPKFLNEPKGPGMGGF